MSVVRRGRAGRGPRGLAAVLLSAAALALGGYRAARAAVAPEAASCPGYVRCPPVDFRDLAARDAQTRAALARIEARFADAQARFGARQIFADMLATLGEAIFFDARLSVGGNQACAFCHDPRAGFRGGIDAVNAAGGIFPGSLPARIGFRVPQSAAYGARAPELQYDAKRGVFFGGNFWDGRASGADGMSPAVAQAMEPFTNPLEMAMPDRACVVRRVAGGPYGAMFAKVWGDHAQRIDWPANADAVCATPAGGPGQPHLHLAPASRAEADEAFMQIASTIVSFELSTHASAFSSKFDAWQAGQAVLSPAELRGKAVFEGRGQCAACHAIAGARPLLSDFAFYALFPPGPAPAAYALQSVPDGRGFVANARGAGFADHGLGGVLRASSRPDWRRLAAAQDGAFATPSLRNVALREQNGQRSVYMHDGRFSHLADVIDFFADHGLPAPAARAAGVRAGALGLSAAERADLLAFLGTLSDGFYHPGFTPRPAVP